jgi:hypothetical protein
MLGEGKFLPPKLPLICLTDLKSWQSIAYNPAFELIMTSKSTLPAQSHVYTGCQSKRAL